MNKRYLLLPRLDVQRANAMVTAGVISLCPVMPAVLMGEAFGHATGAFPEGVMLVHHDAYLLADQSLDQARPGGTEYYPHQFRGATAFNGKDIAGGDKKKPSNSIQPTASMNGTWSVIMSFDADQIDADSLLSAATQFLGRMARLAGGVITHFEKPQVQDDLAGILAACRSGFVAIDRSPWLVSDTQTRIERLLAHTDGSVQPEHQGRRRWLVPAALGYALLTDPVDTAGARNGLPHAFAEVLLGLVELVSIRQTSAFPTQNETQDITLIESCFWRQNWPTQDVFLLNQEEPSNG